MQKVLYRESKEQHSKNLYSETSLESKKGTPLLVDSEIPWATVEKVKDELEPFYVKEWLELERLNEVMSWKVKLMLTDPTYISVPMLYGGKMEVSQSLYFFFAKKI